jgi:hypothetical protein
MIDPIAVLSDPFGFLHYCYLSAKLAIYRRLQPTCGFCHREASDWSTRRPLCAFHFDEIMSWRSR